MKNLWKCLPLALLLGLVLVAPAQAEDADLADILPVALEEVLDAELVETADAAPTEAAARPTPVFLAGSNAGGAGAAGLVNGESSSPLRTYILLDDHDCCPVGATGCECHTFYGKACNPIYCPQRSQPNC